jgi:hypothetical protein
MRTRKKAILAMGFLAVFAALDLQSVCASSTTDWRGCVIADNTGERYCFRVRGRPIFGVPVSNPPGPPVVVGETATGCIFNDDREVLAIRGHASRDCEPWRDRGVAEVDAETLEAIRAELERLYLPFGAEGLRDALLDQIEETLVEGLP